MSDDLLKQRLIGTGHGSSFEAVRRIDEMADEITRLRAEVERLRAEQDAAVLAEKMRMMSWCAKRQAVSRKSWEKAARKALAGDMAELRNRIAMIDAGPLDIVLSDTPEANHD